MLEGMGQPATSVSYAEYLAIERASETKHEYVNGQVYAMAGGTPEHARLALSFGAELRAALRARPCVVFSSDARIRIRATGRSTYPDLSVVCGRRESAPDDADAITNPVVLVEVLSDSTELSDRGDKWRHYQQLPSLMEYVLVSQHEPRIELFRRDGSHWQYETVGPGGTLVLASLDARLSVDDIYRDPLAPS